MTEKIGKVYLIGAGPGDPGLITYKGLKALASSDAVCFDALLDPTLIVTLPQRIERHYVGKRSGHHYKDQQTIESLLIQLANQGKTVARLKAGDPMIFGRGGEELEALREAGIPYEIIPGVTAATAVAAYTAIPITHRDYASWATFFTAHESAGKEPSDADLPYDKLASLGGGTLIGYMGIKRLNIVTGELIKGGMSPDTPAAVVERGASQAQRIIKSTLEGLPAEAEKAKVQPPGLIIVGKAVDLHDRFGWFRPGVLAGKRVLVTRPAAQAGKMYEMLRMNGATVVPAPSIRIENHLSVEAWNSFSQNIERGGWLVFTSENGVTYFIEQLFAHGYDWRVLGKFKLAVIGTGTMDALKEVGLKADFIPSKFSTPALAAEFADVAEKSEFVVRVRGNLGDTKVEDLIADSGAEVLAMQVYDTLTAPLDEGIRHWVDEAPIDFITFTSGSTAESFIEQWGSEKVEEFKSTAKVASIGPFTTKVARDSGFDVPIEAETFSVEGIVEAIVKAVLNNS